MWLENQYKHTTVTCIISLLEEATKKKLLKKLKRAAFSSGEKIVLQNVILVTLVTLGGSMTPCVILSIQVMLMFEDTVECLKCRVGCLTIPVILLAVRL